MRHLVIILLLIGTTVVNAQKTPEVIFRNLHNGAILVRLTTNSNTLAALKGKNDELAAKIIEHRDKNNREIIDAFSEKFHLCKVYYFYSDDSKKIAQQDFRNLLMDKNLNKIKNDIKLENNYLIAEFSYIKQNTTSTWTHSEWGVQDGKAQNIDYYSGGNEKGPDALVLLMPNFQMTPNNYPQYTRTFERMPIIARSKAKTVERLQFKIETYLKELQ